MICLINMPLGSSRGPNLALGQIKAQLAQAGLRAKVFNFNLYFARYIGIGAYEIVSQSDGNNPQIGEWFFAEEAWRRKFKDPTEEFFSALIKRADETGKIPDPMEWIRLVREKALPYFMEKCLETLAAAGEPKVAGFSCAFFQNNAALALGRLLKERFPKIKLAYGGSGFHGEIGDELVRKASWMDAVSIGEADDVVVPLFQELSEGRSPTGLQGIIYRDENGEVRADRPHSPASRETLESLPHPDFSEFFKDASDVGLTSDYSWLKRRHVYFEASRGCWWGEKRQCAFCGLNGVFMKHRAKSGEKVYEIISHYFKNYPAPLFRATDNNMSMEYFDTLIPMLKKSPLPGKVEFFFEIRTTMTREQMKALAEVGVVYSQPGIESLSANILKRLRKGVSVIQNIYFLKLCRQYGVVSAWNTLIRVPGEQIEDYREMEALIPKITHLQPPHRGVPHKVECHRHSPYHEEKKELKNIRPRLWYQYIYPDDLVDLSRAAYYFDADWQDTLNDEDYAGLFKAAAEWSRLWSAPGGPPVLTVEWKEDGSAGIRDTRAGSFKTFRLDQNHAAIYKIIDDPSRFDKILDQASAGTSSLPENQVREILDGLVESGLAVEERGVWLGLAVNPEQSYGPLCRSDL